MGIIQSGTNAIDNLDSNYVNLTAGTTVIKTGAGNLYGIIVNSHTSGTIRIIDSSTIVTITPIINNVLAFPSGAGSYNLYGMKFGTGCLVVVGGTADVTIAYR